MCDGAPAPCSSSWRRSQIQFENPYCASSGPKKRENGSVGLRYAVEETGIVVSLNRDLSPLRIISNIVSHSLHQS